MIDGLAEESYNDTNQWHYDSQNLWSTVLKDPKLELHAPPHQGVVHENHVCMVFSKKQISEQHWLSLRPRNQSLVGGLIYDFLTYSHKIAGMAGACKLAPNFFCWLIMSPHCRVRTGYGILEKLWNFENEIPYMEKLWNLRKTAVPMEKLWNFR